jgi:hypothetical protein
VADLVWLGDDLTTRATWLAGRLAFGHLPPRPTDNGARADATTPADHRVRP